MDPCLLPCGRDDMLVLGQEEEAVGPGSALARLHTNKDFSLIWIFACFICLALDPGRNILARWSAGKFLTGGTVPSLGIVALVLTEDVGDLTMGPSYVCPFAASARLLAEHCHGHLSLQDRPHRPI